MQRAATLVLLWVLSCATVLTAAAFSNSISDIKITTDKKQEKIQLFFSSGYKESVSTDFENGLVQITFPNTSFDSSLAFLNVNDRFIQNIRMVKIANSAILEVHFADPGFNAVGMIKEKPAGQQFTILINKTAKFAVEEPEPSGVPVSEPAGHSKLSETQPSNVSFLDTDMTTNIVKMLVALFLLLLFFYLLLWVYNRFFVTRFRFQKGKYEIKVSSSYHISPKQKIIVLEVNGSAYACGVTANNISVIAKVSADSFSDYLSNLNLHDSSEVNFSDIRSQYLEAKKKQESIQESVKPDSKFASELIQRIKGLKPLD